MTRFETAPFDFLGSGARVDAQHFGDVRAFVAGADADFEGFARLHGVDAALSQHAPMEKGVC
jgi:hypothetical protein